MEVRCYRPDDSEYCDSSGLLVPSVDSSALAQHVDRIQDIPYTGAQFVSIPEFQGIGTAVGQQFSAALAGQMDAEQALTNAQQLTEREMMKAGYIK